MEQVWEVGGGPRDRHLSLIKPALCCAGARCLAVWVLYLLFRTKQDSSLPEPVSHR